MQCSQLYIIRGRKRSHYYNRSKNSNWDLTKKENYLKRFWIHLFPRKSLDVLLVCSQYSPVFRSLKVVVRTSEGWTNKHQVPAAKSAEHNNAKKQRISWTTERTANIISFLERPPYNKVFLMLKNSTFIKFGPQILMKGCYENL